MIRQTFPVTHVCSSLKKKQKKQNKYDLLTLSKAFSGSIKATKVG